MTDFALALSADDVKRDTPPLSTFLDRAYAARNQLRLPGSNAPEAIADVLAEFRKVASGDKELTAAATTHAASIARIDDRRCAITKAHKAFLRDALAQ